MMKILTVQQMTEVDRLSTEEYGIPSLLLMENAGSQVFGTLDEVFGVELRKRKIAVVCGKGNNGGDGFVAARHLQQRGADPLVFLLGKADEVTGDARINLEIWRKARNPIQEITAEEELSHFRQEIRDVDIIVDAILGTGLSKPLAGRYAGAVEAINETNAFILAVDIPSGMFSDDPMGGNLTVRADVTVTFTAPKISHILNRDLGAIGELKVVPIGSPAALLQKPEHSLNLLRQEDISAAIPERRAAGHKGNFGHVALVAGSRGKTGAAALSALAALRCGSGLVTACIPENVQGWVAPLLPEVMTEGIASTERGTFSRQGLKPLLKFLEGMDAVGIGPGLTTDPETADLALGLMDRYEGPLVIDADGINILAKDPGRLARRSGRITVLTPHPGEFARLLRTEIPDVQRHKLQLSGDFSRRYGAWVVLKDFRTIVAAPSGQTYVCPLGNPGMATAGMGDVLTGMVTSLVGQYSAQGLTGAEQISASVSAAVYLHSLAGDLAAEKSGPESLTARSVIRTFGKAFREISCSDE